MKAMSRSWMALVVGVAVMAAAIPSWAEQVSYEPYTVPIDYFNGWFTGAYDTLIVSVSDPITGLINVDGLEGVITSHVYRVRFTVADYYMYLYQVTHKSTSQWSEIDAISFAHGPIHNLQSLDWVLGQDVPLRPHDTFVTQVATLVSSG